jgi:flavin reductase (DIM6/NTAB) family NADH-FMN oxidoreductase RutF
MNLEIAASELNVEQSYRLLTGIIVPRPIAWVTTTSDAGVVNLAPFSHFTFVSAKPPMVAVSIGRKGRGYKDTAENILANQEFVVNIADVSLVEQVHQSAIEYPPDVSEVDVLGLTTLASRCVRPPRVERSPIQLECRLHQHLKLGERQTLLIIGEVIHIHVRDDLIRDGKIETRELRPLARLAGSKYATLGDIISLPPIARTPKS